MDFQDQTLTCKDCRNAFVFTAGEQKFFAEQKFTPPLRCKPCRQQRKLQKAQMPQRQQSQRGPTCSTCGADNPNPRSGLCDACNFQQNRR